MINALIELHSQVYLGRHVHVRLMPDLLSGEEEQEILEAIHAFERAISRLDPVGDAAAIANLQSKIDAISQTLEEEVPTPLLCQSCNKREHLLPMYCGECNGEVGLDGHPADGNLAYLPLEKSI